MDITQVLEPAINGGISVLLAIVVIYWYRADTLRQLSEARAREAQALKLAEQERQDKLMLLNVLGENNKVKAELTQAILELRRELTETREGLKYHER